MCVHAYVIRISDFPGMCVHMYMCMYRIAATHQSGLSTPMQQPSRVDIVLGSGRSSTSSTPRAGTVAIHMLFIKISRRRCTICSALLFQLNKSAVLCASLLDILLVLCTQSTLVSQYIG